MSCAVAKHNKPGDIPVSSKQRRTSYNCLLRSLPTQQNHCPHMRPASAPPCPPSPPPHTHNYHTTVMCVLICRTSYVVQGCQPRCKSSPNKLVRPHLPHPAQLGCPPPPSSHYNHPCLHHVPPKPHTHTHQLNHTCLGPLCARNVSQPPLAEQRSQQSPSAPCHHAGTQLLCGNSPSSHAPVAGPHTPGMSPSPRWLNSPCG
jgi:hypothetical protein